MVLRHCHPHVCQGLSAPHFHPVYEEHEAFVAISSGEILEGFLPKSAARLVKECTLVRRTQLTENWRRAPPSNSKGYQVSMPTKVVSFERIGNYGLRLQFNDGAIGTHDFKAMVSESGTMLVPLRTPEYFARVFLECGALTWPNGFDIAPEWLQREIADTNEFVRAPIARPQASELPR